MWSFILSTLRAGQRGRSIQGVLVLGVVLVAVAYLSASFSPRQPKTVALDVGLSGLRFSLVLLALFAIQEMVSREIDRKTVFLNCTYPVARGVWLVGRFLGIALLLGIAALLLGLMLWVAVLWGAGSGYEQQFPPQLGMPYFLAIFAVWLDALVVAAFALCIASLSTVSVLPLALGVAFAIAGKGLGPAIQYITDPTNSNPADPGMRVAPVIEWVSWLLPDLSRLDWRAWPMYNVPLQPQEWMAGLGIGVSSAVILVAIAVWVFKRREFE